MLLGVRTCLKLADCLGLEPPTARHRKGFFNVFSIAKRRISVCIENETNETLKAESSFLLANHKKYGVIKRIDRGV